MIDIEKIAWLARIKLNENEKEELYKDISKILEMFKKIQEIKINEDKLEKEENFNILFREECIIEIFNREKIINNFPKKEEDLLEVPKTL